MHESAWERERPDESYKSHDDSKSDNYFPNSLDFTMSPSGTILTWNSELEKFFGYSAQEILGHPFQDLVCWNEFCDPEKRSPSGQGSIPPAGVRNLWMLQRNGGRLWCNVKVTSNEAETLIEVCDAREALLAAERFRCWRNKNAEYYKQAVLILNLTANISSWDERAHELFGFREPEIIGKQWMELWTPDSRNASLEDGYLMSAARFGMSECIKPCKRRFGSLVLVLFLIHPLEKKNKQIAGFYIVATQLSAMD